MERKHKIEIIIAVLILLVLGILLFLYFMRPAIIENIREDDDIEVIDGEDDDTPVETVDTSDLPDQPETIARVFVERFGSFSSESGYDNIDEVSALATSSLQDRLLGIAEGARGQDSESYYGVSTTVLTFETVASSDSSITLLITTQRAESIDSPANTTTRYQEIEVAMIASGDTWLVDSFTWAE